MRADRFFHRKLPLVIDRDFGEEFPLIFEETNLYKGNISLIYKIIDLAYELGFDNGISTERMRMFHPDALNN